jgi:type IV secretion system protein VirB1
MIDHVDFLTLAHQCAPAVHHMTMSYLVKKESSFNPFAIGVVGGALKRQPTNLSEAVATANELIRRGINFSVGLSQVNYYNWKRYGLTVETAFDPCRNLASGSEILAECFKRAVTKKAVGGQAALGYALSCYWSGNFVSGFKGGYVNGVIANANAAHRSGLAR